MPLKDNPVQNCQLVGARYPDYGYDDRHNDLSKQYLATCPETTRHWHASSLQVEQEVHDPVELIVTGTIPSYVAGTLYRTGPRGSHQVDTEKAGAFKLHHWFDGFVQNHRFQIIPSMHGPTRVLYNSRSAVDSLLEHIRRTGQIDDITFAQKRDPCTSIFRKIFGSINASIGLHSTVPSGDGDSGVDDRGSQSGIQTLWSKTDAAMYRQLDPETLEPIGYATQTVLHPSLRGQFTAAHAKSDPFTGDVYNYNLDLGRVPTYRVFRVSAVTGKTDIIATITDAPSAYLHSILLTESYLVLCVWNAHFAWGGLKILWERNMLDSIASFDPTGKALWYVVDRIHDNGVVAKFQSDPFFCFHTINAWEEPSSAHPSDVDIVADLSIYENLDILKRLYYENLLSSSPGAEDFAGEKRDTSRAMLRRFRLPSILSRGASQSGVAVENFTAPKDHSCDLPTVNPHTLTKPSRYIYGVTDRGNSTFFDGLVKYDTYTREPMFWFREGQNPGEPIFIPDPDGKDEQDGVLLSVSFLLVLDARTMEELGRASMECAVGLGFHGLYASSTSVGIPLEV
ncbi:carotenoid oxygenase [Melanogaster broomeanus]|nr:carotenoid oxygenase [Melanogaster broomeanus]